MQMVEQMCGVVPVFTFWTHRIGPLAAVSRQIRTIAASRHMAELTGARIPGTFRSEFGRGQSQGKYPVTEKRRSDHFGSVFYWTRVQLV
jgi:hypothetical protein